jgi:hypothetical protein
MFDIILNGIIRWLDVQKLAIRNSLIICWQLEIIWCGGSLIMSLTSHQQGIAELRNYFPNEPALFTRFTRAHTHTHTQCLYLTDPTQETEANIMVDIYSYFYV